MIGFQNDWIPKRLDSKMIGFQNDLVVKKKLFHPVSSWYIHFICTWHTISRSANTMRAMRFVNRTRLSIESSRGEETSTPHRSGPASNSASRNLDNQLKTRRKVAKMLIAVVIMFSINFFPVHFLPVLQVHIHSVEILGFSHHSFF